MFKKYEILKRVTDVGIVAVVRADSTEEAIKISKACIEGGIPAIEITFTVPGAHEVIKDLNDAFSEEELIVGAGTVMDSETARIAILNGAKYIVSPHFDEAIAKCCNRYSVPYMAGCMTIKEIVTAMEAGVDIVKLFPGSAFGPNYIKAVKGPIPNVNIMPTGGVSIDNVDEWFRNGVIAVGAGGALTKGTPEQITEAAKAFVSKIKEARQ
ncbi:MAG: bifunctional 2-keto-4-hydroxyglutarate aldolase/2-keto-3-deoxy-6-phosphogluconate aldolase [Clostridiales bacterium]|nr:bifunctional 2-keto-4-hydroxyglutarate aldolase/2-keto-3-deoxy-6-phosphogluconate aldolase [Clostridiales bacterium]